MNYKREEIHSLVINYKETKDRVLLDKIAEATQKIIYKFGKSYKGVPTSELNSIYGVALMKALDNWNVDGRACFTSYLSTIIINELKMYLRSNQTKFENNVLNEMGNVGLANLIVSSDDESIIIYENIVNDIINEYEKERTREGLRMYAKGHKIEEIVNVLNLGRTNFYYDVKTFKSKLMEEILQ